MLRVPRTRAAWKSKIALRVVLWGSGRSGGEGFDSVFYFPLMTSLLISLVLSFVFWLIGRR